MNIFIAMVILASSFIASRYAPNQENTPNSNADVMLYGVPYTAEVGFVLTEEYVIKNICTLISSPTAPLAKGMLELFKTFTRVAIRAVNQPATDQTQSYFQRIFQAAVQNDDPRLSHIEKDLVSRMTEIEGRLGVEAQMSRGVYERLYPILEYSLSAARSAIEERANEDEASDLIIYAAHLLTNLYPEMKSDDATTLRLVKTSLTENLSLSQELQSMIRKKLEDIGDHAALKQVSEWGILEKSSEEASSSANEFLKKITLGSIACAGYLVPALAKTLLIPRIADTYLLKDFPILSRTFVNFFSNQIYYGITNPHTLMIGSETQKWMISHSITKRVDEEENTDRADHIFSAQNRKARTIFSPQAQNLRTHLILMLRVLAPHFKEAREKIWEADERAAMRELVSGAIYLRRYFPEVQANDLFLREMAEVFFSKWVGDNAQRSELVQKLLESHDPDFAKQSVCKYYSELFANWGITLHEMHH